MRNNFNGAVKLQQEGKKNLFDVRTKSFFNLANGTFVLMLIIIFMTNCGTFQSIDT